MILVDGLGFAGAVLSHSGSRLSATRHAPWRRSAFAGICAGDDVPIARRLMVRRQPKHRFERDVTVKATVVAEDELVEVRIDMLAAQAMVGPQRPPLHQ
jgi:hypothetical protein